MTKYVSVIPFPLNLQQEAWDRVFLRETSAAIQKDEHAFVQDSQEIDLEEIQIRARRRGIFNCELKLPLLDQMAPGCMRNRYQRYVEAGKEQCSSSSLFVDLSQGGDPTHSVIELGHMPALTKSSQIMSLSAIGASGERGHFMTARELDFSQGWPAFDFGACLKYHQCLQHDPSDYYAQMSPAAQSFLRGNGQHLQSLGCWMNWSLSSLLLLQDVERFDPVLMCYHIDDANPFKDLSDDEHEDEKGENDINFFDSDADEHKDSDADEHTDENGINHSDSDADSDADEHKDFNPFDSDADEHKDEKGDVDGAEVQSRPRRAWRLRESPLNASSETAALDMLFG